MTRVNLARLTTSALRLATASAVIALLSAAPSVAQSLIPTDFFNAPVDPSAPTSVDANTLVFNGDTGIITANGDVVLSQDGYRVTGQGLVYNRRTDHVQFTGAVTVRDPSGNVVETRDLEVTGRMKVAFINALTITTYDGARITADSADYDAALLTLMEQATYSPCGECIDSKGRRIGWSVSAAHVTYNNVDGSLYLEQPSLAVLGVPIAWLPFLWLPDTSDSSIPRPTFSYGEKTGASLGFAFTPYKTRWTDIILTPSLMSRQGLLLGAEWVQRFDNGSFQIKASGLYQLDKGAFSYPDAQRDWRGALQSSGSFTPFADWTVGWSYTAFTDAAYLTDYNLTTAKSSVDEVYATYLTSDTYFDARAQEFNRLGNVEPGDQERQGSAVPALRFDHVEELAPGMGRIDISARLLGVNRGADYTNTDTTKTYTLGYAGNKQHASLQAGWQTQWIGGGGFVATPYLGGRADVAYYEGASLPPGATTLWSATPIAAMDVRFPVSANDGSTVHLIEPIGQLVYRGSDTTLLGITNDNAQSFVFDDTNLFSYNRFSGSDRQETGLRANIGGRYQANFVDGSYIEVIAGQSFQLAGANAFASVDHAQTAVGAGLSTDASYAVLGAYASLSPGIRMGGKVQVDTTTPQITRASLGASFSNEGYSAGLDYDFIAANPAAGVLIDQQEIGAKVGVPIADYWTFKANADWDLTANNWLRVGGGVQYDDGYLVIGADASRTGPTHTSPNETRVTATFRLKAPSGFEMGYKGAVPLPSF